MERVQCELAETRQRGDLELTRVGEEYDATKQSLEDLEVGLLICCPADKHVKLWSAALVNEVTSLSVRLLLTFTTLNDPPWCRFWPLRVRWRVT